MKSLIIINYVFQGKVGLIIAIGLCVIGSVFETVVYYKR